MLEIITIEREIINTPTEINEIGFLKFHIMNEGQTISLYN